MTSHQTLNAWRIKQGQRETNQGCMRDMMVWIENYEGNILKNDKPVYNNRYIWPATKA